MVSLYNKYRPHKFSEVLGQEYIVKILQNSVAMKQIDHAYLFSGPKGTGKTTLARIFSSAINCENPLQGEPCGKCKYCQNVTGKNLDVIEIDAASHTGVDNIRELKDNLEINPAFFKYKVYIIDEVHMLSTGAFNALLKSLEEPPAFVVFILATTELRKIPPTIISRCQKFSFQRIASAQIMEKLKTIVSKEDYQISKEALEEIVNFSEGGMRDAESLLGQIMNIEKDKKITLQEVREILGLPENKFFDELIFAIYAKKIKDAFKIVTQIAYGGYDIKIYLNSLIGYLRDILIFKIDPNSFKELGDKEKTKILEIAQKITIKEIGQIISQLLIASREINESPIPHLPLELALIRIIAPFSMRKEIKKERFEQKNIEGEKNKENFSGSKKMVKKTLSPDKSPIIKEENSSEEKKTKITKEKNLKIKDIYQIWPAVAKRLKPYNHSLWGVIQNCQPIAIDKNNFILVKVKYDFYRTKLEEPENKKLVQKALEEELGKKCEINYLLEKEVPKNLIKGDGSLVSRLINDFGGEIIN